MDESAHGIILRLRPLTETSLIVHWLTTEAGRVATVAKGARRPKSPFRGQLDLLYEAQFTFARARRSELHALRELKLTATHPAFRHDLARLHVLAYATALIEQTTEMDTPLPEISELFLGLVRHLNQHPSRPRLVFAFELKLLRELGLEPNPADTKLNPAGRQLLDDLMTGDWPDLDALKPAAASVNSIRQFLHGFLIYHLHRLPHGRAEALRHHA